MELLLVGLGTGFAIGLGVSTWLSGRLASAERAANIGRGERTLLKAASPAAAAWEDGSISVRGTVPVTQEAQAATVIE